MSIMTGWRENVAGVAEENRRPWQERWQRAELHWTAAIGEGICPDCLRPLDPAGLPGCAIAGHCVPCGRYWYIDYDCREVGWMPDHDPQTGIPHPPERP